MKLHLHECFSALYPVTLDRATRIFEIVTRQLSGSFLQTEECLFQGGLTVSEYPVPPPFIILKRLLHKPLVRVCLYLVLAWLCGLVLGLFQVRAEGATSDPWFNGTWAIPLWFPFALGVAAPFLTVRVIRKSFARFWLSVGVGILFWIGIAFWWFPIAENEDAAFNAFCLHSYCHVPGLAGVGLLFYLLFGMVLILVGALVTSLFLRVLR